MEDSGRFWPSSISSGSGISGFLNTRSIRCFHCLQTCSKRIVSVEPLVFLCVFTIFVHLTTFELYAFSRYSLPQLSNGSRNAEGCVSVQELNENGRRGNNTANFVQGQVSLLNLYVGVASQIPGIVSALILGPLSDRYGRKVALGVVLIGLFFQSVATYCIIEFNLSLYFFVLGSGLKSLAGGQAGLLTVSRSFVSDISSRKWLTLRLGILVAVSYIASSLGLFTAGLWIGESNCDFHPISLLILVLSVVVVIYLLLFVRESLSHRQTGERQTSLASGAKSLLTPLKIFFYRSRGVPLWKLWFALLVLAVTVLNQLGFLATVILFSLHEPLEWKPGLIGTYLAASEFIRGLSSILLLPILVCCSLSDPLIALVGVCIVCITNIGTGFVKESWQMFIAGTVQGVDAIITPALQASMSKLVPHKEQGALFSVISAVQVLSGTLAFVIYSLVYKLCLGGEDCPLGSPFWLMAFLYFLTTPFLITLARYSKRTGRPLFVNSEHFPQSPGSPPPRPTSPPVPTIPHPHHSHQTLPPHLHNNEDDYDGMGGSIQWALSRSQSQRYQPPQLLSPASMGKDLLERHSLLGRGSRTSSYGSHPLSINS